MELNKLQGVTEALNKYEIWEARKVETSDPNVVEPNAQEEIPCPESTLRCGVGSSFTSVDISGFEREDVRIGTGKIQLQIGMMRMPRLSQSI